MVEHFDIAFDTKSTAPLASAPVPSTTAAVRDEESDLGLLGLFNGPVDFDYTGFSYFSEGSRPALPL